MYRKSKKNKGASRNTRPFAKEKIMQETFVPMQDFYAPIIAYIRLLCNTENCDLTLYEQA